jgi:hypothetical protein
MVLTFYFDIHAFSGLGDFIVVGCFVWLVFSPKLEAWKFCDVVLNDPSLLSSCYTLLRFIITTAAQTFFMFNLWLNQSLSFLYSCSAFLLSSE